MDSITFVIDWVTNRGVNGVLLLTLFALLNFLSLIGSVWVLSVMIYENTNITTDISECISCIFSYIQQCERNTYGSTS